MIVLAAIFVGLYFVIWPPKNEILLLDYMDDSLLLKSSTAASPITTLFLTPAVGTVQSFNFSKLVLYDETDTPLPITAYGSIANYGKFDAAPTPDTSPLPLASKYLYDSLSVRPSLIKSTTSTIPYLVIVLDKAYKLNKYTYSSDVPLASLFGNMSTPGVKIYENPVANANMTKVLTE